MAYTDDAVKAKLSALNETQESIVTVAQWVMFHRRHADRTATLWLQRLKDSGANKRLNLIYLANEVAQQSKARKKDDFLVAFSPIIAEASATAYRGATNEVQQKLRRVIEVWRQRSIFDRSIQDAVEARIDDLDKSRSSGKKSLGGSLFSNSSSTGAPLELQPLVPLQTAVTKASIVAGTASSSANIEFEKLTDPATQVPTPPVHAARLSALLKSLANAEGAVSESIKARHTLIGGLEKLLETNRSALTLEESQRSDLTSRKAVIEIKKRDVEDGIMRGLSESSSSAVRPNPGQLDSTSNGASTKPGSLEPEPPKIESLTPPPTESFTPPSQSPGPAFAEDSTTTYPSHPTALGTSFHPPAATPGSDLLSSLSMPPVRHHAGSLGSNGSASKKRKLDEGDFGAGAGGDVMADLDEDVAELLRAEGGGV